MVSDIFALMQHCVATDAQIRQIAEIWPRMTHIERANVQYTVIKPNMPLVTRMAMEDRAFLVLVQGMLHEYCMLLEALAARALDEQPSPGPLDPVALCVQTIRSANTGRPETDSDTRKACRTLARAFETADERTCEAMLYILSRRSADMHASVCRALVERAMRLFVYDKKAAAQHACRVIKAEARRLELSTARELTAADGQTSADASDSDLSCIPRKILIRLDIIMAAMHKNLSCAAIFEPSTALDPLCTTDVPADVRSGVVADAAWYNPRPDIDSISGYCVKVVTRIAVVHATDDETGHSVHLWVPEDMLASVETLVMTGTLVSDDARLRRCLINAKLARATGRNHLVLRNDVFVPETRQIRLRFND